TTLVEQVASRRHDDIVRPRLLVDAFEVVFPYAVSNADNRDGDAVVGSDDTPGGGGTALAVNGRLEELGGGNDSRSSGRHLDVLPASVSAGLGWLVVLVLKTLGCRVSGVPV